MSRVAEFGSDVSPLGKTVKTPPIGSSATSAGDPVRRSELAALAPRRLEQALPGCRPEREDRDREGRAEAAEGTEERPDQQLATAEAGFLGQGIPEALEVLGGGRDGAARLDVDARRHQPVRPHHDPGPDPAEADHEQDALDLGLAAKDVHDQQPDPGQERGCEQERARRARQRVRSFDALRVDVRVAVARSMADPARQGDEQAQPDDDRDEPFAHRTEPAERHATG